MKIEKIASKNLLAIARAYAKATGKSLKTVGREVYGRAAFFEDLRRGKQSVTVPGLDVLLTRFAKAWPAETPWPAVEPIVMTMPAGKTIPKEKSPAPL